MHAAALVFVVEDDASLRASLQNLLRSVGLRVEVFASAQEFLRSTRPDVPSCLVLDVRLPGLSGLELQQELAQGHTPMPIIFITGHGDIPMTVRAMKAGASDFLTKPFRDEDLLNAVAQALHHGHQRASNTHTPAAATAVSRRLWGRVRRCATCCSRWTSWLRPIRPCSSTARPGQAKN